MIRKLVPAGAVVVLALVVASSAHALPGPQGRITQLAGEDACVSETVAACEDGRALVNAFDIAISPDGENVYVAGQGGGVAILSRDASTGDLDQLPGAAGCVGPQLGCLTMPTVDTARAVEVSRDGDHVYVATNDDAIVTFQRNADGSLVPLGDAPGGPGGGRATDCVAHNPGNPASTAGCADGKALENPRDIVLSPDGSSLYLVSAASAALAVFDRDTSGADAGKLSQHGVGPTDDGGCLSTDGSSDAGAGSCTDVTGSQSFNDPQSVTISPDGDHVYVGAEAGNAVHALTRASDGTLTHLQCVRNAVSDGTCVEGKGVAAISDVAVSPDGAHLYATNSGQDAITYFDVAANGSLELPSECVSTSASPIACADKTVRGTDLPVAVSVSPDGKSVYAAALNTGVVASFSRNAATGAPEQLPGAAGCVAETPFAGNGTDTCADGTALIGASELVVSPGNTHLYASALGDRAAVAFARQLPPQCVGGSVAGTLGPGPHVIALECSDPNGDPITGYSVTDPPHGTLGTPDVATGTVVYTPDLGYDGPDQFTLNAEDDAPEAGLPVTVMLDVDTFTEPTDPMPKDTTPPQTTAKGPKAKTTKAKVKVAFSSSEPNSTFECKLDKAAYKPCASPFRKKVKIGKHKLFVRATDAAGNTDPTPAKVRWRRVDN